MQQHSRLNEYKKRCLREREKEKNIEVLLNTKEA
jgi:hypothetical protein